MRVPQIEKLQEEYEELLAERETAIREGRYEDAKVLNQKKEAAGEKLDRQKKRMHLKQRQSDPDGIAREDIAGDRIRMDEDSGAAPRRAGG